jgi:hypothetical protein
VTGIAFTSVPPLSGNNDRPSKSTGGLAALQIMHSRTTVVCICAGKCLAADSALCCLWLSNGSIRTASAQFDTGWTGKLKVAESEPASLIGADKALAS